MILSESQSSKVDSPPTPIDAADIGEEKRGHIFRYGRANVFRYGKRAPSVFRYGKRASVFRYGKRDDEDLETRLATLFPKRIFRYGKRMVDNDEWDQEGTDALQQQQQQQDSAVKRLVFRYGKRSGDFGAEKEAEEEEERKLLVENSHKEDEFLKEKDEKRPIFRYGRSIRLPNVPFRFGDE